MAASFPTSYDALTNPGAGSLLTAVNHADQHTNSNDIVEAIEQRVGLSGAAFPGGPSSGQFFHRTDRRLDYYYDGTRWLTEHLYEMPLFVADLLQPQSATGTISRAMVPWAGVRDLYLKDFQASFYVDGGTALGASHKWTCQLRKLPGGTVISTVIIDSGATFTWRNSGLVGIDALVGITNLEFDVLATKTGTPGNLYFSPLLYYRQVG